MALIKCTECNHEISDKADICPHCGCPVSIITTEQKETRKRKTGKYTAKRSNKKRKIILGVFLAIVIVIAIIVMFPSRYNWNDVILKSVLPEPTSKWGNLYTNDTYNLYLSVSNISFTEYEKYVADCVNKGFTYAVESRTSSYTAFNSDGYELDLNYYEYDEVLDISIDVRIIGTISWSDKGLALLLPTPISNVGNIVNDNNYRYELYLGHTSKTEYNDYVTECELNGFNTNIQKQDAYFYAENELGNKLEVEYFDCNLIHIEIVAPDDVVLDDNNIGEISIESTEDSNNSVDSDDYTSPNTPTPLPQTPTRYCEVSGCTREGTKTYIGISSRTEYYCSKHYDELIDMFSDMEEDVGAGSYSKHTCEECSREGTHSIIGISGRTEYYCTKHYEELMEFMEIFG